MWEWPENWIVVFREPHAHMETWMPASAFLVDVKHIQYYSKKTGIKYVSDTLIRLPFFTMCLLWEPSTLLAMAFFDVTSGRGLDENALRDTFRVEFIAPDGTVESGVDGGGLFKAGGAGGESMKSK